MALSGGGAICIWNDITDEGRDEFYAWHLTEHMPERVGIPGFLRGRRCIAVEGDTTPEFFTLYETASPDILVGRDYQERLEHPTPWTTRATAAFRNTSRALTRVRASFGAGPGGIVATIRFGTTAEMSEVLLDGLADILPELAGMRQITGAHFCLTDAGASAAKTAESRDRTDILDAPDGVVLIEGCNPDPVRAALRLCLQHASLHDRGAVSGLYRLEHTRLATARTPG